MWQPQLISVVAVNDAPAIHVDTPATYVENAAAIALSPLATLTDVDDAELNEAVVRITGGTIPGDGDTLTVGGLTSGTINGITFLWDAAEHALVFTGASLVANYQDLLRTVEFHSTSDNPTDFNASSTRTLTWSVSDGTAVTTATTTLNIVAVNDAPQATVAATASYTENGAPVVLSPASTATDVDDITLVAGEVRIVSGAVDGDLLTVNGLQSGTFSGIDFSYDPVLRSLTFTHPADVADYKRSCRLSRFPPRATTRPIPDSIRRARCHGLSLTATHSATCGRRSFRSPPWPTRQSTLCRGRKSVNEDATLPIAGVSVADVDSPTLTTLTHGMASVAAPGPPAASNMTATVTITGTAAEINMALAGLSYTGNLNFNGPDTLTVTTGDGARQRHRHGRDHGQRGQRSHRCSISTPTIRAARRGRAIKQLSPRAALRLRSPTSTSAHRCRRANRVGATFASARRPGRRCPGGDWSAPSGITALSPENS